MQTTRSAAGRIFSNAGKVSAIKTAKIATTARISRIVKAR
jgi:hypothetical protein